MRSDTYHQNKQLKQSRRFPFVLIVSAIGIPLVFILLQVWNLHKRSRESDKLLLHTNQVLKNLHQLGLNYSSIDDAGGIHLLWADPLARSEFHTAVRRTEAAMADLMKLTRDNALEQKQLQELSLLIRKKIQITEALMRQVKAAPSDLYRESIAVNSAVRRHVLRLQEMEGQLLKERARKSGASSRGRLILSIASLLSITTLLGYSILKMRHHVNRRMTAESQALASEAKYRALVEDAGVIMLVVNDEQKIQFASKYIHKVSGFEAAALVGTSFLDYIPADFQADLNEMRDKIRSGGHYNDNYEIKIITRDKKQKWVSCRMFPVVHRSSDEVHEWQIILWDIDEEKKLRLELEALEAERSEQSRLVQEILDNIPMVVFIKDIKGRYRIINTKMAEVLQMPAESVVGKTDAQLNLDKGKYDDYRNTDEFVLHDKRMINMDDVLVIDGERRYFWVTKLPLLDDKGNVKFICCVAADVTAFKEVEHKLIEAKEEAERARAAQEAFLANISHEIRTPMNGIIGMTNLLNGTELNKIQQEFTESIQESARSLLALINDLLDVSKMKSGKFRLEQVDFDIREIVKKVLYPLQYKASEKGISLDVNFDAHIPAILTGDPLRLQQIIINLVNNAIKFTTKGGVTVDIKDAGQSEDSVTLLVDIADTGIGIPAGKLKDVFESYTQSGDSTARLYGGTGLGLNIVKQLVELQQGRVWVRSREGEGSVFSFEIPYKINASSGKQHEQGDSPGHGTVVSGLRILVAEDNMINQKVVLHTLQRKGAEVTLVANGKEAVDMLRDMDFDIVLMDMQMPVMDGYEATRHIRKDLGSQVPVIAMTANALKGEAEKCLEAGVNAYISKPFDQAILYEQIINLMGDNTSNMNTAGSAEQHDDELVDFSYVMELAGDKPDYIHQLLSIFMEHTPSGLKELEALINTTDDWDRISKQAHFLKSSVGIVKIRGVHERLQQIETLARERKEKDTITRLQQEITDTFSQAEAIIREKMGPGS